MKVYLIQWRQGYRVVVELFDDGTMRFIHDHVFDREADAELVADTARRHLGHDAGPTTVTEVVDAKGTLETHEVAPDD